MKMHVNRFLLERKSDKELEEYIVPESRFVPEAIEYAYEILRARGRVFDEEERERLEDFIKNSKIKAVRVVHPNYAKAANLIYLSGLLGIVQLFVNWNTLNEASSVAEVLFSLAFVFSLGLVASKGFSMMKIVLLVFFLIGILGLPTIMIMMMENPVAMVISIIQFVLQAFSVIVLFKIPNPIVKEQVLRS